MDNKSVLDNIRDNYEKMFSAEKKVADYILKNPEETVTTNVSELAKLSGVSDASVVRMCKRAGFNGYAQMRLNLSHDLGRNPVIGMPENGRNLRTVKELFQVFVSDLMEIADNISVETLRNCVELIKNADTVHIAAAGNTVPIATDFGFRLGRYGIRNTHNTLPEYFLNNVNLAREHDIVFGISRSGSSKQVVQALELAKQKNLKTIAITGHEYSPISNMADYLLLSKPANKAFTESEPEAHINELAIIDALLYFIGNEEVFEPDSVEIMLSEYKV